MIRLGEKQELSVLKKVEFGVYVGEETNREERVLLPRKQVPEGTEIGDKLEVFVYRDSKDRLIATTTEPKLLLHKTGVLRVAAVGKIGAFLDWGLEKELFLPFKEQTRKVAVGEECLVALYIDKSSRLCATMNVYPYLQQDSPYHKDDMVQGTVYEISDNFGAFVAVDNLYSALIAKKELYGTVRIGDRITGRVVQVKEDGKLDLSVRGKIPEQMDKDAELILECIETCGGKLPFTDKADPERIKAEMGMSKAAFKRAVGRLLKQKKIVIKEDGIYSL